MPSWPPSKAARVSETDRDLILGGNFNRLFTTSGRT